MCKRGLRTGFLCVLLVSAAWAQERTKLSGKVVGTSGVAIGSAKVTAKNLDTGKSDETETNTDGVYTFTNLTAGDYEISAAATGFNNEQAKVTLKAGQNQDADLTMSSGLSLSDLGFGAAQTQGSAKQQALLNKRSHMLHVHQELGLITTGPLVATVVTGLMAGGKSTSSSTRDLHAALGSTTAGLYAATAYYAIFAPKVPGTKTEGSIKLHKDLVWIHGPGMILTPILGAMAFDQKSKGEKVHGIASAHGAVAITTVIAYGLAVYSVWRPSFSHSKHDMTLMAPPEQIRPLHPYTGKPIHDAVDGGALPGSKSARSELAAGLMASR